MNKSFAYVNLVIVLIAAVLLGLLFMFNIPDGNVGSRNLSVSDNWKYNGGASGNVRQDEDADPESAAALRKIYIQARYDQSNPVSHEQVEKAKEALRHLQSDKNTARGISDPPMKRGRPPENREPSLVYSSRRLLTCK